MSELTNYELLDLCIKCCGHLEKYGRDDGIIRLLKNIINEIKKRGLDK